MTTSTPLAANTSTAEARAGSDNACESMPMYSGPVMPSDRRDWQMAWLMARMCASLKLWANDEPRCPDVPKATRCAGSLTSG